MIHMFRNKKTAAILSLGITMVMALGIVLQSSPSVPYVEALSGNVRDLSGAFASVGNFPLEVGVNDSTGKSFFIQGRLDPPFNSSFCNVKVIDSTAGLSSNEKLIFAGDEINGDANTLVYADGVLTFSDYVGGTDNFDQTIDVTTNATVRLGLHDLTYEVNCFGGSNSGTLQTSAVNVGQTTSVDTITNFAIDLSDSDAKTVFGFMNPPSSDLCTLTITDGFVGAANEKITMVRDFGNAGSASYINPTLTLSAYSNTQGVFSDQVTFSSSATTGVGTHSISYNLDCSTTSDSGTLTTITVNAGPEICGDNIINDAPNEVCDGTDTVAGFSCNTPLCTNHIPKAIGQAVTVASDNNNQFQVTLVSQDPDAPAHTFNVNTAGTTGAVSGQVDAARSSTLNYTPPVGFKVGDTDSFTFSVFDGIDNSSSVTVSFSKASDGGGRTRQIFVGVDDPIIKKSCAALNLDELSATLGAETVEFTVEAQSTFVEVQENFARKGNTEFDEVEKVDPNSHYGAYLEHVKQREKENISEQALKLLFGETGE
jgi:hypothetical protein